MSCTPSTFPNPTADCARHCCTPRRSAYGRGPACRPCLPGRSVRRLDRFWREERVRRRGPARACWWLETKAVCGQRRRAVFSLFSCTRSCARGVASLRALVLNAGMTCKWVCVQFDLLLRAQRQRTDRWVLSSSWREVLINRSESELLGSHLMRLLAHVGAWI